MYGCRTLIGVGCFALSCAFVVGCGGAVVHGDPDVDGSSGSGQGGGGGRSGASSGGSKNPGRAGAAGTSGAAGSAGKGIVDPDPVDTGCPPEELPPPENECDPFSAGSCGPGAGCYPFVEHPEGSGCDQQRYGTVCLPAGSGMQGMRCGDETGDWCAPGFVCVVGQRAGKRCAALCKIGQANQCQGGLLCGDLDVAGFGVCG
jgi:hypothetical protein